jgi:uncharacterized membrane protein
MIPEILATLLGGTFAGAAIYVNFVEQPARLSCGVAPAVTEWRPSYKRGTLMQAPLALVGSLLAFLSSWLDKDAAWLIGGILLLAVIPFTLLVMFPTNKALESSDLDVGSARAEHLLRTWGKLHAVRSALSLVSFAIFLVALSHKP